jgi:NAD(P)-dependent dehydrogenase (short-subunit alcohol dehydrogenase family)
MSTEPNATRRALLTGLAVGGTVLAAAGAARAQTQPAARANPNGRFAGKVIAVTGATSGIGRVTAERFAMEGGKVAFCGRRENLGAEVVTAIKATGGDAHYIKCDVRDPAQVKAFIDGTVTRYAKLDVLFANAGIGQAFVDMGAITPETQKNLYDTNVAGKYNAIVAAVPHLERTRGSIINMSSIFGVKAGAQAVAYCGTMHAVSGITLGAALELAPKGIRVNGVAPGAITDTQFMVPIMGRGFNAEEIKTFGAFHALGRTGTSLEVANAVLWLASDEASFVSGEIMKVDGYFLRG